MNESSHQGTQSNSKAKLLLGLVTAMLIVMVATAVATVGGSSSTAQDAPQSPPAEPASSADVESPDALALTEAPTTTTVPPTTTTTAPTTTTTPLTPLEAFDAALAEETTIVETFYNDDLNFLRVEVHMILLGFAVRQEVNLELTSILELVATSDIEVDNLDVAIHTDFLDATGNSVQDAALRASWTGDTIASIDFDNFLTENALEIGELVWAHPAIEADLGQ